jgi:putative aldouronate transport system permease protein
MLLPGFLMVLIFKYIPMAGLCIAFQDYFPVFGMFEQEWVGFWNRNDIIEVIYALRELR